MQRVKLDRRGEVYVEVPDGVTLVMDMVQEIKTVPMWNSVDLRMESFKLRALKFWEKQKDGTWILKVMPGWSKEGVTLGDKIQHEK